jgi:hypothetical protein
MNQGAVNRVVPFERRPADLVFTKRSQVSTPALDFSCASFGHTAFTVLQLSSEGMRLVRVITPLLPAKTLKASCTGICM